jgi:hypothetical protein
VSHERDSQGFTWDSPLKPFRHGFSLSEKEQVVAATGFGVGPTHIESAERLSSHKGSGAFSIEIEIADMEIASGDFEMLAIIGIEGASQTIIGCVGMFETLLEALNF